MESMGKMMIKDNGVNFWHDKKIFLTGHTGFKGSWLSMWLLSMGAIVSGYALKPPTKPNLFDLTKLQEEMNSVIGDIRDQEKVLQSVLLAKPEIVIHMAAQPLVRESYKNPLETYGSNVMGTANLLEAVRQCPSVKAVVVITTDKCYENREWIWSYRENDVLGGYDPYSSSKACAELVTNAYRDSFFNVNRYNEHGVAIASARAGNVIGGGDWAKDRLLPDCMKALAEKKKILIRNPRSIRPWQHVLEPLSGYLELARNLYEGGVEFSGGWNFGPEESDAKPVSWIVERLCQLWGGDAGYQIDDSLAPHEAHYLKLDCSKAKTFLAWKPRWSIDTALKKTIQWVKLNEERFEMRSVCMKQIEEYKKGQQG